MNVGQLITISGLDGAGNSTQLQRLRRQLEAQGYRCASYCFNVQSYRPTARQTIDQLLVANVACLFTQHSVDWSEHYPLVYDFIYDEEFQTPDLAWAVSLVFANASVQVTNSCRQPLLDADVYIICDRYWYDEVIYRSCWVDPMLIRQIIYQPPTSQLALLLDVTLEVTWQRNQTRRDGVSPLLQISRRSPNSGAAFWSLRRVSSFI
ncbi:MAG: hypothetical protein MI924_18145 [Chloroflexales bacterium]|nr:hypothetical protein [Chloroflexales bacterium]